MQLLLHSTFFFNKHSLFILLFKIFWSCTLEAEWFWSAHKSHHKVDWNNFFKKIIIPDMFYSLLLQAAYPATYKVPMN